MDTTSLDEFAAVNEQLAALAEAGVPLDVSLGDADRRTTKALERIRATVTRRVNRGETLEEALLGDDEDVPVSYRSLLQLGIHSGNLSTALNGSCRVAESLDDSRFTLVSAFIYPLMVCSLAYLGLIGFCFYLVPVWHEMYTSVRLPPGIGLRILQTIRDTLPYWVAIPPSVLLLILISWRRSKNRRGTTGVRLNGLPSWLPGARRSLFQERCARFAASLGELLDGGTPLDESLRIAGDVANDSELNAGAHLLAADVVAGGMPADDTRAALLFPPFLRWTLWHADDVIGRSRALKIAARMYREAAERRAERLRTMAPIVVILIVGGTVTLLYGLALFVPFTELMRAIATGASVR